MSQPTSGPRSGDVIICCPQGEGQDHDVCTLCSSEQLPQVTCRSREEAVERAHEFAREWQVDGWDRLGGVEGTHRFELVARYRQTPAETPAVLVAETLHVTNAQQRKPS